MNCVALEEVKRLFPTLFPQLQIIYNYTTIQRYNSTGKTANKEIEETLFCIHLLDSWNNCSDFAIPLLDF